MRKTQKKIRHIWSIICDSSSIDVDFNNVSLFSVIEELKIPLSDIERFKKIKEKGKGKLNHIVIPLSFEIVTLWRKSTEGALSRNVEISLLDPKGKKIQELKYEIEIKEGVNRLRSRMRVNGIRVREPGEYTFKIDVKKGQKMEEFHRIPLPINFTGK